MMKIMRASAGSGKTFNLAKTYITILLKSKDRYAYRHILAVTFTNKATAEMKARILKELHTLAVDPQKSGYYKDFVPSVISSGYELQRKAKAVLTDILHDYSAFSISTIDKFFQQALKAFSRELGHFSAYQVELDRKSLVHESVDRILDSLKEDDKSMIKWLNEGVMEQLGRGKKVDLESGLYDMADKLKSDEFRELTSGMEDPGKELFSKEKLTAISRQCNAVSNAFIDKVVEASRSIMDALASVGLSVTDTNGSFLKAIPNKFLDLKHGDKSPVPTDAFMNKANNQDLWFSKANAKLHEKADGVLDEPLKNFCDLFGEPYRIYRTALLLKDSTFSLGIAAELDNSFTELTKEKNVLGIDDSNFILKDIIDGCDTPFIYEKLGVRYENFLLDEFQDTSTVQWQNFYPLLAESNSHADSTNLVVGDVKQSIYRWRGSDWKLLSDVLPNAFKAVDLETLDSNYRSTTNVVSFNNALFTYASQALGLSNIYSDVNQNIKAPETQPGSVEITFCSEDLELAQVLSSIEEVRCNGAKFGDIAVLVRDKKEGSKTAQFLVDNDIPVVSDDSLSVKSSVTVRRLVSLLYYVENPADTVSSYLAKSLDIAVPDNYRSLVDLCEGFLRLLKEHDEDTFNAEVLYIQSFMDSLQDWCSINGQNLVQFLQFWKDADPKISSPADQDAVRIMTIHKSKGLEFPHVIFPFAEKVEVSGDAWHWCRLQPETGNNAATELSAAIGGVFPISFSSEVKDTLFEDEYNSEKTSQLVDNLNVLYVALTRAEKSLHVIAKTPPESYLNGKSTFSDFSQLMYSFVTDHGSENGMKLCSFATEDGVELAKCYSLGQDYLFRDMVRKDSSGQEPFNATYTSIPLSGRLELSEDAADFFSEDGTAGIEASPRVRGVVLHNILSKVIHPADLNQAVRDAVVDGLLSEEEGCMVRDMLAERISRASARGWFPDEGEISNEVTLIAKDGNVQRPDRVVTTQQGTVIIDYKFGSDRPEKYVYQVRRYVRLYREMGYPNVSGCLWYVQDDEVVNV